ncbi:MAG: hypothetical protein RLN76_06855 [Phycisphaeraceae bacterium]
MIRYLLGNNRLPKLWLAMAMLLSVPAFYGWLDLKYLNAPAPPEWITPYLGWMIAYQLATGLLTGLAAVHAWRMKRLTIPLLVAAALGSAYVFPLTILLDQTVPEELRENRGVNLTIALLLPLIVMTTLSTLTVLAFLSQTKASARS